MFKSHSSGALHNTVLVQSMMTGKDSASPRAEARHSPPLRLKRLKNNGQVNLNVPEKCAPPETKHRGLLSPKLFRKLGAKMKNNSESEGESAAPKSQYLEIPKVGYLNLVTPPSSPKSSPKFKLGRLGKSHKEMSKSQGSLVVFHDASNVDPRTVLANPKLDKMKAGGHIGGSLEDLARMNRLRKRGVVDNIRGAKESIVSKPKEFAHLIKNKFGSADNINNIRGLEESQGSTEDGQSHPGSGTLPSGFKYHSEDEASSVTSESGRSGTHSSPRPPLTTSVASAPAPAGSDSGHGGTRTDLEPLLQQMREETRDNRQRILEHTHNIESIRNQVQAIALLKQSLDEERYHSERMEEQINDLTEFHQHEITNIKQELTSMEEKMEYQLEERTRDMQELLDACQTRISKMEMQQQQQQLISMEGIENSNFRALITKLINVVLALLAVILVLVSTIANLLGPFLTTRLRILSTVFLIALIVATVQNWDIVKDLGTHVVDRYQSFVSGR